MLNVASVTLALLTLLQADAALALLLPDGVWFAEAPHGSTRFAIVQLVSAFDVPMFGGPAYKDTVYLVEARALANTGTTVEAAWARITVLLTDAALAIDGYGAMLSRIEEEVETVEVDELDPSIRWYRCGGHLHVLVTAATATT